MRDSKLVLPLAACLTLLFTLANPSVAEAGDACKNVKFKYTNKHNSGKPIRVVKVKYFNKDNGKWQTEDVHNEKCSQGETCVTNGDNLRDSEGVDLTKVRFIYNQELTVTEYNARGEPLRSYDTWTRNIEGGDKTPTNPTCWANRTYGPGSNGWTIFGKK